MDGWEEVRGLSPEEQTEWLKARVRDWDQFVEGIRVSHEQLEAHRAAGGAGLPPGWISLDDFRKQRGLPSKSERVREAPARPAPTGDA